jgi:hypothetical protein
MLGQSLNENLFGHANLLLFRVPCSTIAQLRQARVRLAADELAEPC